MRCRLMWRLFLLWQRKFIPKIYPLRAWDAKRLAILTQKQCGRKIVQIKAMIATGIHDEIKVHGEGFILPGELEIPGGSSSLVLFSHGSGSSRLSPRNQLVAGSLRENGIGTFLF